MRSHNVTFCDIQEGIVSFTFKRHFVTFVQMNTLPFELCSDIYARLARDCVLDLVALSLVSRRWLAALQRAPAAATARGVAWCDYVHCSAAASDDESDGGATVRKAARRRKALPGEVWGVWGFKSLRS